MPPTGSVIQQLLSIGTITKLIFTLYSIFLMVFNKGFCEHSIFKSIYFSLYVLYIYIHMYAHKIKPRNFQFECLQF